LGTKTTLSAIAAILAQVIVAAEEVIAAGAKAAGVVADRVYATDIETVISADIIDIVIGA